MDVQPEFHINTAFKRPTKSVYFKIMKLIYQTMFILFCYDFGFSEYKSKKHRIFWKFLTIIRSAIMYFVSTLTLNNYGNISMTIVAAVNLTPYFLTVVFLALFNPNTTISKFYIYLEQLDLKMRVNNACDVEKHLLFGFILDSAYRIIVSIIFCAIENNCIMPAVSGAIYLALMTSSNLVYSSYIFVFHALNYRLKSLACILNTSSNPNFSSLQEIYKTIVKLAESYKSAFDPVFIVALLFYIPKTMATMYQTVQELIDEENSKDILRYRSEYLIVAEILAVTLAPAIFAGILATQANRIKIILHHKLMEERDETKIYEIERFIHYIKAQPCRFRVCKIIPLDADLLKLVLNFCVTYLIVLIQFTNK